MRGNTVLQASLAAATLAAASMGAATQYELTHLDLGSGLTLDGTIDTDGTLGSLSASSITDWNITATMVQDFHYTNANTVNLSSGLFASAGGLFLNTSPDGAADGGMMTLYHSNYQQVRVADFSGAFTNGGTAMYSWGGAFDYLPLGQPNGAQYQVASGSGGSYSLVPLDFGTGTTLFGTVQTNGALGAATLTSWDIVVRTTQSWSLTKANSAVRSAWGVSAAGGDLLLTPFDEYGNGNSFVIGYGLYDPTLAILGDFSMYPDGEAGFVNPLMYQTISPLTLNGNGDYVVASAVPEPATFAVFGAGLWGLVAKRRRAR